MRHLIPFALYFANLAGAIAWYPQTAGKFCAALALPLLILLIGHADAVQQRMPGRLLLGYAKMLVPFLFIAAGAAQLPEFWLRTSHFFLYPVTGCALLIIALNYPRRRRQTQPANG